MPHSEHESVRLDRDTMGAIEVPAGRYYGAQTARALIHFPTGADLMPPEVIRAFAILKNACARCNEELGKLPTPIADLIARVADEIVANRWPDHFPLSIWQSGSGTQTNMNVNEVIANRANELASQEGLRVRIHPNDHVNMSQSSNDAFPGAMHMAAAQGVSERLLPSLTILRDALAAKQREFGDIVKIGRTHLMDAVPLTLGQEFSGYVAQINQAIERIGRCLPDLFQIAIGGTAVGTGLNAPPTFGENCALRIARMTGLPFKSAENKFAGLACHDAIVMASGALRTLSCGLMKIANDVRWMGSGPRCGLAELLLPENEPGSSIMPGKVNPTQCELVTMACVQVIGNDTAIAMAGSMGNFELNVFKPVIIHNFLHSLRLLSDVCASFTEHCIKGLEANRERLGQYVAASPMLATALNEAIGYDNAAKVARHAIAAGKTVREACLELDFLSAEEFDRLVNVTAMCNARLDAKDN